MRVRVPASSANLGPGFDVLALALGLYVTIDISPAEEFSVRSTGQGAGRYDNDNHLAAKVARGVLGHDRFALHVDSEIPLARGLGSSAAVAVAAAAAAGSEDPLAAGVEVDGHGENAAASLLGGLVAAADVNGAVEVVSLSLDPELRCVVVIPDVELATATAREVVPTTVARADAVFNLQRQARLVAGLGNLELLASFATEDRLHQPFRSALLPWSSSLLTSMVEAGALASAWSGAGSTMIAFLRENEVAAVLDAARSHMAEHSEPADVRAVAVDRSGLTVL